MADPTKSITTLLNIDGMSLAEAQTAINDEKVLKEADGFVCVSTNRTSYSANNGINSHNIVEMEFREESSLVSGNGSVKTIKKTILHSDLVAAAVTETVTFDSDVPAGCAVVGRAIKLDTVFSGGTVSACTVDFGDAADVDGWMDGENVFTGQTTGMRGVPAVLGAYVSGGAMDIKVAARTPQIKFICVGDNAVNLSAGSLTAYIQYVENTLGAAIP